MRLDAFLLADAVSTPPGDDKFYIHGGGLTRFVVPMLPFPLGVAVFIRFEVEDADIQEPHRFRILVFGPVGLNLQPIDFESAAVEPTPLLEGEQRFIQVGLTLPLGIIRTGLYRVELHVDEQLLGTISVPLVLVEPE
jgi:hypothetical protein